MEKFLGYTSNINLVLRTCCFPDIDGGQHGLISETTCNEANQAPQ